MAHGEKKLNFTDYVIVIALTIGVLALIPLIAVLGFALQFAFVLVAPVVLIGGIIYALSTKREVIVSQAQGVSMPSDVGLYAGHSWARRAAPGTVVTGADDFAQRVIGPVDAVETLPLGTAVKTGDIMAVLRRGEREIPVAAPVDGRIGEVNPSLREHPDLVNAAPYGRGWIVELVPDAGSIKQNLKQLLSGGAATRWMRREVDRLVMLTVPEGEAPSLADGGELSSDVCSHVDDATWRTVVAEIFT